MNRVKFLDCTLRDGGYVNHWQFGADTMKDMLARLTAAGLDIIECGFLTDLPSTKDQSLFHSPKDLDPLLPDGDHTLYVAMIAIGEKEMNPTALPDKKDTKLGGIRLTFHPEEVEKAFCYGEMIQQKGYRLFMQPVGTAGYSDEDLIHLIKRINRLQPYAFYLVDTLGTMYGKSFLRQVSLADHNLAPSIRLGYHSHNNLQMSFANAQQLLGYKTGRGLILDCSASGMGRGAGNLCTELILQYFNTEYESRYNVLPVLEVVDRTITPISLSAQWGYACPYFLSAARDCHPNYASYLMGKQTVSVTDVSELLDQIPPEKRERFDKTLIEHLYQTYQSHAIEDQAVIDGLRRQMEGRKVLVLAPGHSIVTHEEMVQAFIEKEQPLIISVNFVPHQYSYDLLFLTNDRRLEAIRDDIQWDKTVLTSNVRTLPDGAEGARMVNYSSLLNTSFYASDSAGMMLLKLLVKCSVRDVTLAGMDGFSDDALQNYYTPDYAVSRYGIPLHQKNQEVNIQLNKRARDMKLHFLTPTLYKIENREGED